MQRKFITKRRVSSTNDTGKIGHPFAKTKITDTYLRPAATKSKFKWIINLNVKQKTSGNIEENLCDLGFGDKFLYAI